MAPEITGTGDPAATMALLWRSPGAPRARRGPRPGLDLDRVVSAAVALADADGLAALSMRRLAAELGTAAMTLYTHVPGKAELVDLMYDSVLGELYRDDPTGRGDAAAWRARLTAVAQANWNLFLRHPWALHLATGRPPLGPSVMAKYERELAAVDGLGLSEVEMDLLVTLVNGFVRGTVSAAVERIAAERATGITDAQWWAATAPHVEKVFDRQRFPTAARVGPAAGADLQAAYDPDRSLAFGLERLLDGVEVLLGRRRRDGTGPTPPGGGGP